MYELLWRIACGKFELHVQYSPLLGPLKGPATTTIVLSFGDVFGRFWGCFWTMFWGGFWDMLGRCFGDFERFQIVLGKMFRGLTTYKKPINIFKMIFFKGGLQARMNGSRTSNPMNRLIKTDLNTAFEIF